MAAASGSDQMLNSADAVVLPSPSEPPISAISAIRAERARVRAKQQRDVRQRPGRHDRHGLGGLAQERHHRLDRGRDRGRGHRLRQVRAIEPGRPVELDRHPRLADERAIGAGRHGDIRPSKEREDPEGVACRAVERSVAGRPS